MALLWAGWCAGPSTIGSHLRGCDIKINDDQCLAVAYAIDEGGHTVIADKVLGVSRSSTNEPHGLGQRETFLQTHNNQQ